MLKKPCQKQGVQKEIKWGGWPYRGLYIKGKEVQTFTYYILVLFLSVKWAISISISKEKNK